MVIDFEVYNLDIICCEMPELVDDSKNYIKAHFIFTGIMWEDCNFRTAIFKTEDKAYNVELSNNECYIPSQVLREEKFTVGVCGNIIDGEICKIFYTKECCVPTIASCFSYELNSDIETPDALERLLRLEKKVSDLENNINETPITSNEMQVEYLSDEYNVRVVPNKCYILKPYNAVTTFISGNEPGTIYVESRKFYDYFNHSNGDVAEYVFTYDGSDWKSNNVIYDLQDCGITYFTDTPNVGETFKVNLLDSVYSVGININESDFPMGSKAKILFKTGSPCNAWVNGNLFWHGDNLTDGLFYPESNKRYEIHLRNTGIGIIGEITKF